MKNQAEERQALLDQEKRQKEEQCRLLHEAERLKLLEDRMIRQGGIRPNTLETA